MDHYRASESVSKLAKGLRPNDKVAALGQAKSWPRLLREEGGAVMPSVWEEWDWPSPKSLSSVREEVLGYFRNPVDRTDYPSSDANGWCIGSGAGVGPQPTGRLLGANPRGLNKCSTNKYDAYPSRVSFMSLGV